MKLDELVGLFAETQAALQQRAVRAVNASLVVRNWLFGCYVVEYEQNGADRAEYGAQLLKELSARVTERLGRGYSVDSLELMRRFYLRYPGVIEADKKSETASRILSTVNSETPSRIFETVAPALASEAGESDLWQRFRLSSVVQFLRQGWG